MATYGRIRSARLLVIGLLLTSLVTITLDARGGNEGPLASIGRVGHAIIAPLQKGVSAIVQPIGGFFSNMFRAGSLAEENAILKGQLGEYSSVLAQYTALQAENARLLDLIGLLDELGVSEFIAARVTAVSPSNFEWYVEVGVDSSGGAVEDMPVITHDGLVGVVTEVLPSSSVVQLLIDTNFRAAVRLEDSRETAVLFGGGEDEIELQFLDPRAKASVGDRVITSGYEINGEVGKYPSGIPVGEISSVERNQSTGGLTVLLRPFVDFTRLEEVALLFPPQPVPDERPAPGSP